MITWFSRVENNSATDEAAAGPQIVPEGILIPGSRGRRSVLIVAPKDPVEEHKSAGLSYDGAELDFGDDNEHSNDSPSL